MEYEQYLFRGLNLRRFKSHIDSFLDKRKDEEKCGSKWNTSRACTKYKIVEVISFFGNKLCLYYEYFETSVITLIQQKHKTLSQIQIRTYINYITKGSPVPWQSTNGIRLANDWNLVITINPGMNALSSGWGPQIQSSPREVPIPGGDGGEGGPREGSFQVLKSRFKELQEKLQIWKLPGVVGRVGGRVGGLVDTHTHTHTYTHTHTVNQRTAGEGPGIPDLLCVMATFQHSALASLVSDEWLTERDLSRRLRTKLVKIGIFPPTVTWIFTTRVCG